MEEGQYFLYNGKFIQAGEKVLTANNRSFRFGDGLFETMRLVQGNIPLLNYHFERLFSSLALLKFELTENFTTQYLSAEIKRLVEKNNCEKAARIRLTVFRSDGALYDYENNFPNYIIKTWKLDEATPTLNTAGLITDVYMNARKTCDDFSHIKSNNYLPYVMGALHAKENKLDDILITNNYNRIADATIANIFLVTDGKIKTPALSEGCVDGVMRRYIIHCLKKENIPFEEGKIEIDDVANAHEIFLTNAVNGMRWIQKCGKNNYTNELTTYLFNTFILPLFPIKPE